jgi:hypothetical protein
MVRAERTAAQPGPVIDDDTSRDLSVMSKIAPENMPKMVGIVVEDYSEPQAAPPSERVVMSNGETKEALDAHRGAGEIVSSLHSSRAFVITEAAIRINEAAIGKRRSTIIAPIPSERIPAAVSVWRRAADILTRIADDLEAAGKMRVNAPRLHIEGFSDQQGGTK